MNSRRLPKRELLEPKINMKTQNLLDNASAALLRAQQYVTLVKETVQARVFMDERMNSALINKEQRIVHGYAWLETTVTALDSVLKLRGESVDSVIRLKVEDASILGRIAARYEEQGRKDDNPETFKVRLDAYNRDTAPLLPYYSAQGKLTEVDGMADIETVAASISEVLDRQASPKGEPKKGFFARLFGGG